MNRLHYFAAAIIIAAAPGLVSCTGEADSPDTPAVIDDASTAVPYDGPPVEFHVDASDGQTAFTWSVTVPTGG